MTVLSIVLQSYKFCQGKLQLILDQLDPGQPKEVNLKDSCWSPYVCVGVMIRIRSNWAAPVEGCLYYYGSARLAGLLDFQVSKWNIEYGRLALENSHDLWD